MLTDTLQVLKKYNVRLDRRKGQNYLINGDVVFKILDHAKLSLDDTVLEIGPGIGTLTLPMASEAKKIVAIEQDQKIATILKKRLIKSGTSNVEVLVADATEIDFPEFNKVVSNLPYQISSPITFKILKHGFDFAILMYQLEFARRMVANPGDSNYSRLSLMMHYCADVEMLFDVPPGDFYPRPKISSSVIKLSPDKKVEINEYLINVSRALFQHKKKKTRNALIDSFHEIADLDKKTAKEIVQILDDELLDKRVLKLDPEEVLHISNQLKAFLKV